MYALAVSIALGGPPVPTYVFSVPGFVPHSTNVLMRCHWSRRRKLLRGDADVVGLAFRQAGIPFATSPRRVSVRFLDPHPRDADNALKSLLDALVACQAILDDSSAWCELGRVRSSRGPRCTVIELADV